MWKSLHLKTPQACEHDKENEVVRMASKSWWNMFLFEKKTKTWKISPPNLRLQDSHHLNHVKMQNGQSAELPRFLDLQDASEDRDVLTLAFSSVIATHHKDATTGSLSFLRNKISSNGIRCGRLQVRMLKAKSWGISSFGALEVAKWRWIKMKDFYSTHGQLLVPEKE